MASDRPVIPERGLESRIRTPTESSDEEVRGDNRGSGQRLDASNLKAVSTAAAAAASGQSFTSCKFTSTNQPAKGKANASPRELEESVRAMRASLTTRQKQASLASHVGGGSRRSGLPGQVYNAVTERWQFVEELDSDAD